MAQVSLEKPDPGPGPGQRDVSRRAVGARPWAEACAAAFDMLYLRTARPLTRQMYILTGERALARRSVELGFQRAWRQWSDVAVDPQPEGWIRAAACEYALAPWLRLIPGLRPGNGGSGGAVDGSASIGDRPADRCDERHTRPPGGRSGDTAPATATSPSDTSAGSGSRRTAGAEGAEGGEPHTPRGKGKGRRPRRKIGGRSRAERGAPSPSRADRSRELIPALRRLTGPQRQAVVLYDLVGLDLPDTAAEAQASTPATAARLIRAHHALARSVPELSAMAPEQPAFSEKLASLLREEATSQQFRPVPPARIRGEAEQRDRRLLQCTAALTGSLVLGLLALVGISQLREPSPPERAEPPRKMQDHGATGNRQPLPPDRYAGLAPTLQMRPRPAITTKPGRTGTRTPLGALSDGPPRHREDTKQRPAP